jgi:hypothetical protein
MAVSKPRQGSADWSVKLTRWLPLKNGDTLVTLADARRVVLAHLMIEVDDSALTHAMRLLLAAAETGTLADRKAATDQVVLVLKWRGIY